MKQLASTTTAALLLVTTALLPSAAFAKEGNDHGGGFLKNISSWFGARGAHAQNTSNRAPSISGITAPTVLAVDEEGTWTVKASDPENGTLSYSVDWNDTDNTSLAAMSAGFVQESTFTHSYATADTYTPTFTVQDEEGKTSKTSVMVRVGDYGHHGQPLIITKVMADPDTTTALISWKTNHESDSTVYFGTTSPIATSSAATETGTANGKNHYVKLTGLTPNTTYYYVVSSSKNGTTKESTEYSFKTDKAVGTGELTIKSFDGPDTLTTDEEGTWTVQAVDPENDPLSYAITWGDEGMLSKMFSFMKPFTQESTFSHTYAHEGTYTVTVTVKDGDGHEKTATTTVVVSDEGSGTDPVLSGITALVDNDSITFEWTTDVATDATIYYTSSGTASTSDAHIGDAALSTSHSHTVTGLSNGTSYSFLIVAKDAEGDDVTTSFSLTTMGF